MQNSALTRALIVVIIAFVAAIPFFSSKTIAKMHQMNLALIFSAVKLASRACRLSAACVHELLCGATFDRGALCFVLKDTEEP